MRRAAKVDANQAAIVTAMRANGMRVQILSMVGSGCPDLLVGFRGLTLLVETKGSGHAHRALAPNDHDLTEAQRKWHKEWAGGPIVVAKAGAEEAVCEVLRYATEAGLM